MPFLPIANDTVLLPGDVIRRTLENGTYDYYEIVGLLDQPDVYELTLHNNHNLIENANVLPYCTKANMILQGYEIKR